MRRWGSSLSTFPGRLWQIPRNAEGAGLNALASSGDSGRFSQLGNDAIHLSPAVRHPRRSTQLDINTVLSAKMQSAPASGARARPPGPQCLRLVPWRQCCRSRRLPHFFTVYEVLLRPPPLGLGGFGTRAEVTVPVKKTRGMRSGTAPPARRSSAAARSRFGG